MTDSGQIPSTEINGPNAINEDSMKIIEEASAIVEQNMKDKFPDLPSGSLESRRTEASIY
jgi:division protein CdvB (Snf7/Vps24/ESCRT-III family)